MNIYNIVIKFVNEVIKTTDVSDAVTDTIMAYIRTYWAQHPHATRQELMMMMVTIERIIRDNTKAFVSFEMFPNLFAAMIIRDLGQKAEERISIMCDMEGEIEIGHFKTK